MNTDAGVFSTVRKWSLPRIVEMLTLYWEGTAFTNSYIIYLIVHFDNKQLTKTNAEAFSNLIRSSSITPIYYELIEFP